MHEYRLQNYGFHDCTYWMYFMIDDVFHNYAYGYVN
jgi:hypothetical protein